MYLQEKVRQGIGVIKYVADRSLTYFLFFLIIYFGYALYEQNQETERLFKIAKDQQETIIEQNEAIQAQKFYIKLLESKALEDYYNERSPIYNNPL
jgi:amino acid permease